MLMDSNKIEQLLDKYWACESSLEEEQMLREYFQKGEYPEQMKETAALFLYFGETRKKTISDSSFDQRVLAKARPAGKMVSIIRNSMRIAAGLAVLIAAFFIVKNEVRKSTPQEMVDTYEDPKLAFEETKKALMMISKSFGTAEKEARKINIFNQAQEQIGTSEKSNVN